MKRLKRQLIGLTGGIGSGKSTVSARLAELGAHVLDADAISRTLLDPGEACYGAVLHEFGDAILNADQTICRAALASLVFTDPDKRRMLESIVHPEVLKRLTEQAHRFAKEHPMTPVVMDIPLLFECGLERGLDETVLVYAADAVRMARVVARDQCTSEHARLRMAAQMPQEQKRMLADTIFDNSGTREQLYVQTDAWYRALRSDVMEKV